MIYLLSALGGAAAWVFLMMLGKIPASMMTARLANPTPTPEGAQPFIAAQYAASRRRLGIQMLIGGLLSLGYLWLLFRFGNLGIAVGAALLMVAVLPEVFMGIRTGKKTAARGVFSHVGRLLCWVALPILCASVYYRIVG